MSTPEPSNRNLRTPRAARVLLAIGTCISFYGLITGCNRPAPSAQVNVMSPAEIERQTKAIRSSQLGPAAEEAALNELKRKSEKSP